MMSRREEVTAAILELLEEEVPEVLWRTANAGAERNRQITGSINCDRISFTTDCKGEREATAQYTIYILDASSITGVDDIADRVDAILTANPDINNWATDSIVKEIIFGVAQGKKDSGVAIIIFEVKFDLIPTYGEE